MQYILGTEGFDFLVGTAGNDTAIALAGNDQMQGYGGDDLLMGNQGNDLIEGGDGQDVIYGGQDADSLKGGAGNDWLLGDRGDDWLAGELGADILTGGSGQDQFVLSKIINDQPDQITDFTKGEDLIVLPDNLKFTDVNILSESSLTIIQDKESAQQLAILFGVDGLSADDFLKTISDQPNGGQMLPVTAQTVINNQVIDLEIAKTPLEQTIGLMLRPDLPDNRGMLFPINPPRQVTFWMKNVLINLDMIFLANGQVQAIFADVPPCIGDACPFYGPANTLVDQVIELRGGRAAELGLQVGDRLNITDILTGAGS